MSEFRMEDLLPERTRIATTPDIYYSRNSQRTAINYETVELKTIDIIRAFMVLKEQAMAEAYKIKSDRRRHIAISKIKSMAHFSA